MAKRTTIPWTHCTVSRLERVEIDAQVVFISVNHLGDDDPLCKEARAFWQASKSLLAAFCKRHDLKSSLGIGPSPPEKKTRRPTKQAAEAEPDALGHQ